ncbi:MAG: hypothetical protein LQ347_004637 [Umbilicaria vellea]|nr:MAG: hypothetical protein LQ347_004637 [Umbilicaria vellea]
METSRNIYKDDVDFQALALVSPEFAKHLKKNGQLDFSNPEAVLQLTKSLLKRDFNLELELPDDRLCPPTSTRKACTTPARTSLATTSAPASVL